MAENFTPSERAMQEELELLEAIYIHELTIQHKGDNCSEGRQDVTTVSLKLHPATGESADQQYVCLTLCFRLSPEYPSDLPTIEITNPRGLAEEHVDRLRDTLDELANERKGECMLYDLIQHAKESLTEGNVPHGTCVICLDAFHENEAFMRTTCYHYFHCHCLLPYVEHCQSEIDTREEDVMRHVQSEKKKEIVCPVCREPIDVDIDQLRAMPAPPGEHEKYQPSAEIKQLQQKMEKLFLKQKAKGGIIDLEAEKNKYLISANTFVPLPEPSAPADISKLDPADSPIESRDPFREKSSDKRHRPPHWRGRGGGRDRPDDYSRRERHSGPGHEHREPKSRPRHDRREVHYERHHSDGRPRKEKHHESGEARRRDDQLTSDGQRECSKHYHRPADDRSDGSLPRPGEGRRREHEGPCRAEQAMMERRQRNDKRRAEKAHQQGREGQTPPPRQGGSVVPEQGPGKEDLSDDALNKNSSVEVSVAESQPHSRNRRDHPSKDSSRRNKNPFSEYSSQRKAQTRNGPSPRPGSAESYKHRGMYSDQIAESMPNGTAGRHPDTTSQNERNAQRERRRDYKEELWRNYPDKFDGYDDEYDDGYKTGGYGHGRGRGRSRRPHQRDNVDGELDRRPQSGRDRHNQKNLSSHDKNFKEHKQSTEHSKAVLVKSAVVSAVAGPPPGFKTKPRAPPGFTTRPVPSSTQDGFS